MDEKPNDFHCAARRRNENKMWKIDWLDIFHYLFIWWRKLERVQRRRGRGDMIHWGDGDTRLC